MLGGARPAFVAAQLAFAIACSGCVAWKGPPQAPSIVQATPPESPSEDYLCENDLRVRAALSDARTLAKTSIDGATAEVTVQRGDTLGLIALRHFGTRARANIIARLNGIKNADLIFPGQKLRLPTAERQCRLTPHEDVAYTIDPGAALAASRTLERRAFTPPSQRVPDQMRIRASVADPPFRF